MLLTETAHRVSEQPGGENARGQGRL